MTPGDAARVLAKAAAFDQRTVGAADVAAWHEALSDLDAADALAAVARHYSTSEQRIMPVHVRRLAREAVIARRQAIERDEARRSIEAYRADAGPLTDRSAEVQAFVNQVRDVLPEGDREALMPRRVAWEREHRAHRRSATGVSNPDYDPAVALDASRERAADAWAATVRKAIEEDR